MPINILVSPFNNFSYKGFELGVFLRFKYDVDVINGNRHRINTSLQNGWNKLGDMRDAWTPANPNATRPRPDYNDNNFNFLCRIIKLYSVWQVIFFYW